jgi:hypothetical protein
MLYVLTNLDEVVPYMKQFIHEFRRRSREPTQQEYDTLFSQGAGNGLPDFIPWFKQQVTIQSSLYLLCQCVDYDLIDSDDETYDPANPDYEDYF